MSLNCDSVLILPLTPHDMYIWALVQFFCLLSVELTILSNFHTGVLIPISYHLLPVHCSHMFFVVGCFCIGQEGTCWVATQRGWCQYGTPRQRLLMVMRSYCSLSSGSRPIGTAPTVSGMTAKKENLTHPDGWLLLLNSCFWLSYDRTAISDLSWCIPKLYLTAVFVIISCHWAKGLIDPISIYCTTEIL